LKPVAESHQLFQRHIFPAAPALANSARSATSSVVRLDRCDRKFRSCFSYVLGFKSTRWSPIRGSQV
jgi:hypothetical protein